MNSDRKSSSNSRNKSSELLNSRRKHKGSYYWLAIGGLGLIALIARPMLMTLENSPAENVAEALPVETMKAQPVDSYQVSRTYTGEIAAVRTSKGHS